MPSVATWGNQLTTYALVVMYSIVFFGILAAMWFKLHPNTFMIRCFRWFALMMCLIRAIEFGVPQYDFGSGVVPADRSPGTPAWRKSLAYLLMHNTANMLFYGMLGLIMYYWVAAWRSVAQDPWFYLSTAQRLIFGWLGIYLLAMVITILVAIGSSFYFVIMLHSIVDCVMALITAVLFVVVFTRLREALDPVVRGPFSTSASAGAAAASVRRSSTTGGGGGGTSGFYGGYRRRLASASSAGGRGMGAGGRMTSPRTGAGAGGARFSPRKDIGGGGGRVGERRLLGVAPYGGGSPLGGWGAAAPPVPHTWTAGPRGPGERLLPAPPAPAEPFDPQQLLAEDEGGVAPASAPTHLPLGAGYGGRRGSGYQVHGARGRSRSSNASPGPKLQRVRYGSIGGSGAGARDAGAAISYEQQQEELEEELRQTNARADKYCRIWGVAIVIIFGQVTHSVTLMYQTWVFAQTTDRSVPRDWWWLLIFIIYLTNEIIVTSGVLYFLRASPAKEPAKERLLGNSNRRRSSTGVSVGMGLGQGLGTSGAAGRSWIGSTTTTAGGEGSGTGSLRKAPFGSASSSSSSRRRSSESSPLRQPALWESRAAGAGRLPGSAVRQGTDGEQQQQQQLPALDLSSGSPGRGYGRSDFTGRRGGVARQGALLEGEEEEEGNGNEGTPSESDSGQDLLESDSEGSDRASAIARAAARASSGSRQRGVEAGGRSQSQSGSEGSRSLGSLSLSMSGPGTGPGRSSLGQGQGGILGPVRRAPGAESGMGLTGAGAGAGAMAMAQGGRDGGQGVGSYTAGSAGGSFSALASPSSGNTQQVDNRPTEPGPMHRAGGLPQGSQAASSDASANSNHGGGGGAGIGAAEPLAPVLESYESEVAFEVGSQGGARMPAERPGARRGAGAGGLRHAGSRSTSSMELGREGSSIGAGLGYGSSTLALPVGGGEGEGQGQGGARGPGSRGGGSGVSDRVPRGSSAASLSMEDGDAASSLGPPPPRSSSSGGMLLSPASTRGAAMEQQPEAAGSQPAASSDGAGSKGRSSRKQRRSRRK